MKQWVTIYQKEMVQAWRNKQLIWVPLVMMMVGVIDLLTYYYLPEVIELSGGLPEGAVFEAPTILPNEAIVMGLEQLSFIGSLIIIAISMGTIANERNSGLAEIILTKPIHHVSYVTAKWFAFVTITFIAIFLAILLNWYYTNALFDTVSFSLFLKVFAFYSVWFLFIVTIVIFFNSFLNKAGIVFACSAVVLFLMSIINTGLGHRLTYFPNQLTNHINVMLTTNDIPKDLIITSSITLGIIIILLTSATIIFKHKKL